MGSKIVKLGGQGLLLAALVALSFALLSLLAPTPPRPGGVQVEAAPCCDDARGAEDSPVGNKRRVGASGERFTQAQQVLLALSRALQEKVPRSYPRHYRWPLGELARIDDLEIAATILNAPGLQLRTFTVSADGSRLGAAIGEGEVLAWDTRTGELILQTGDSTDHYVDHPTDLQFSDDGSELLVTSDTANKTSSWTLPEGDRGFRGLNGEAKHILSATDALPRLLLAIDPKLNTIDLWDIDHGGMNPRTVITLPGVPDYYARVRVSPESGVLAVQPEDGRGSLVVTYDLDSGEPQQSFDHGEEVGNYVFSQDGDRLATAGYDDTVRLWDLDTGVLLASRTLRAPALPYAGYPMPMVFTADGRHLVVSVRRPEVTVLELPSLRPVGLLGGTVDKVEEIYLLPDGRSLLVRGRGEVFLRRL